MVSNLEERPYIQQLCSPLFYFDARLWNHAESMERERAARAPLGVHSQKARSSSYAPSNTRDEPIVLAHTYDTLGHGWCYRWHVPPVTKKK